MGELRATAEAEKMARRHAILAAAADLLARWSLTDITVDRIAARAGIAKGTVYLYYRTKETLFLSLFEELLDEWHANLREQLAATEKPIGGGESSRIITATLLGEPVLLRLYSVPLSILEKDLDFESFAQLNRRRERRISETASVLDERVPAITVGQARHFLKRTEWVVAGLVQAAASTPPSARPGDRRALSIRRFDLSTELQSLLTALIRAATASA